jgi:hypothetical protein
MYRNSREDCIEPPFGSQSPGGVESLIVIVPPYCGAPRVSHQLPVLVVVEVTETGVDVVEVVLETMDVVDVVVGLLVVVALVVVVEVVVVVDELHEARTIEAMMARENNPKRAPFFTFSSFIILSLPDNSLKIKF